jgi:hypothetical protein
MSELEVLNKQLAEIERLIGLLSFVVRDIRTVIRR